MVRYNKTILTIACFLTLFASNPQAEAPVDDKPDYIVTYHLSDGLKSPRYSLTPLGYRLLPQYMITSSALPIGKLTSNNLITIRSAKPNLRYCESTKNFCWPKVAEMDGTYIRFTSYDGTHRYALDTSNMHRMMWDAFYENYTQGKHK